MMRVELISSDPIAARVLPKLLESTQSDMTVTVITQSPPTEPPASPPDAILLDCRFGCDDAMAAYLRALGPRCAATPAIILQHGRPVKLSPEMPRPLIVDRIDTKNVDLKSLIAQIGKSIATAVTPQAAADVPHAANATPTTAASPIEIWGAEGKAPASGARHKTGRIVNPASTGKLRWHELYRDQRLLIEETRANSGRSAVAAAAGAKRFERRCSRGEAIARLTEYAQARPLKASVRMALQIARDSTATVEDLARVVKQDQGLAARVLQLANCSLHRRGTAVRTIEQAIVRLGVSALRETIASTNVLDQFDDDAGVLNVSLLWEHGYAVGMLAADLARCTRTIPVDNAFMIGLLHDMGRAVMAHEFGQDYIDALIEARMQDVPPAGVEKQFFEINHADVADALFANWEFDESIISPIANHHLSRQNLKHMAPVHVDSTLLLEAADTLAHAALLGDSGSDWIRGEDLDFGTAPVSQGFVRTCVDRADKTLEELRLLCASMSGELPTSYADRVREQIDGNVSLEGLDASDAIDPMAVLAWQLSRAGHVEGDIEAQDEQDAPAPVILASVRSTDDVDTLRHALAVRDDSGPRPSLVLTVADEPLAAAVRQHCGDRPLEVLPNNFRVAWVVRGINLVSEAGATARNAAGA